MPEQDVQYAGFWVRVVASIIDSVLIVVITVPLMMAIFGFKMEHTGWLATATDVLITWIAPAIAVIVFWITQQATPGKMAVSAKIVDARTGGPLSVGQSIGRYLGYFVAGVPLGLGLIWVAFDKRKQGWHDKMAGTVVIMEKK